MSNAPRIENCSYDAIIIGTGLTESILSAALSVAGSRVLHLDANSFYGAQDASLPLEELIRISRLSGVPGRTAELNESIQDQSTHVPPPCFGVDARQVPVDMLLPDDFAFPHGVRAFCNGGFVASRRVILDLSPRTTFAAGSLIDLMVQTGVGHYVAFRPIEASFLYYISGSNTSWSSENLERVPASRSDIFQSRSLSMVEKRLLMRFMTSLTTYDDGYAVLEHSNTTPLSTVQESFQQLMIEAGLTEKLQAFLRHAIVFDDSRHSEPLHEQEALRKEDAQNAVMKYRRSLMRFGTPTSFLYPNYGTGEMSEAFCRLSAVHGGTFVLRRGVRDFFTNCAASDTSSNRSDSSKPPARCGVVTSENECLRSHFVFVSGALVRPSGHAYADTAEITAVWRFAGVVDGPVFPPDAHRVIAFFPRMSCGNGSSSVRVMQLNSAVQVCPDGTYVLYAETLNSSGVESDIMSVLENLVNFDHGDKGFASAPANDEKRSQLPRLICSVTFPARRSSCFQNGLLKKSVLPSGYCVVNSSTFDFDGANVLAEARRCFQNMRPASEFFAPHQMHDSTNQENGDASYE